MWFVYCVLCSDMLLVVIVCMLFGVLSSNWLVVLMFVVMLCVCLMFCLSSMILWLVYVCSVC